MSRAVVRRLAAGASRPLARPAGDELPGRAVQTWSGDVVLREPVDRPRLLRLAIRSEAGSGADVARGVVARIDGGYFLAGPPGTPLHTVALWAGLPPYVLSVGCLPTEPVATVEVWPVREALGDLAPGPVTIERYGEVVTLACGDSDGELVVDLVWADR